jgi:hypothetical protein
MNPSPQRFFAIPQNSNARAYPEAIALHSLQPNLKPVLLGADLVAQETNWTIVIRDQDIDSSVVVNVTEHGSATHFKEL